MQRATWPVLIAALLVILLPAGAAAADDPDSTPVFEYRETPDDPQSATHPREDPGARSAAPMVTQGPYESIQANVDSQGQNIVGDAANEPSIAVNPTDPSNIIIGWRQFDTIASNFRQAGWAYSNDTGQSWTFPGVLTPGIFRSDPVLGFNSGGVAYYQSLKGDFTLDVFKSFDGGATWSAPTASFGGDKNWMTIDRTGGIGDGNIYGIWQRFAGCCGEDTLTRSTNNAFSFEVPVDVVLRPTFGTIEVGPEGNLYMAGIDGTFGQDLDTIVLATSTDAEDPGSTPSSSGEILPFGAGMGFGNGPNPAGLLGQVNVAVDHSNLPSRGNVYVVASLNPDAGGTNPLDVLFSRSVDEGRSWSAPVRINDDPPANAWHWLAAHSVAPNGRIDVIWADTRGTGTSNLSSLYYSYSYDQGDSWAPNVAVSPQFNSHVGWPNQSKMGDYFTIISDEAGAGVAYSATFNGEQDVYYLYVFPDCNGNGLSDVLDSVQGGDCNDNSIPDSCESAGVCVSAGSTPDGKSVAGDPLTVARAGGGELLLDWDDSCIGGDSDYGVYEGSIGDFTSHAPRLCTTGGATTAQLDPDPENAYYLIVPRKEIAEGSHGKDSAGDERPVGVSSCRPQEVGPCGFVPVGP